MNEQHESSESNLEFSRVLPFNMETVSPEILLLSRKNNANFLQAIDSKKAVNIAEMMGVSESAISRLKSSGTLGMVCMALACAGLKVVPHDAVVYIQPEEFN